jgi:pimeloyl-ACP methyl ester carboxylesterase
MLESTEWTEVVSASGLRLRTIVTVPHGGAQLPAIFIAGWLSCDSIEVPPARHEATDQLLRDLIEKSGAIVFRVDKPGLGDSEGVCATTDFTTELDGYKRAFAAMQKHPRVDAKRIVVVGISNGGGFAPLVAGDTPVLGYVTVGGWSKTWFEHMIDLERRRVVMAGTPAAQAGPTISRLAEFHAAYLFLQLTPAEVVRARPHLRSVWYDEPDSQYGRPAAFYHQLQQLDLAAAWGRVRVPTLVVWGEYDWIMDRADQEMIVRLVNADGVERASLYVAAKADHGLATYPDRQAAFEGAGGGAYSKDGGRAIVQFVRKLLTSP